MFLFFPQAELQMRAIENLSRTMSDRTAESHSCPQTTQKRKKEENEKEISVSALHQDTDTRHISRVYIHIKK